MTTQSWAWLRDSMGPWGAQASPKFLQLEAGTALPKPGFPNPAAGERSPHCYGEALGGTGWLGAEQRGPKKPERPEAGQPSHCHQVLKDKKLSPSGGCWTGQTQSSACSRQWPPSLATFTLASGQRQGRRPKLVNVPQDQG